MHMTIGAIVEAETKDDAIGKAEEIFENLVSDHEFDYYNREDPDDSKALHAGTPEGKALIQELWRATESDFKRNMVEVRAAVTKMSDEDFLSGERNAEAPERKEPPFYERDPSMARHTMCKAGAYAGFSVWLYNRNGSGIRDRRELKDALEQQDGEPVWIVTTDVHY